jgi:hypothetical protein
MSATTTSVKAIAVPPADYRLLIHALLGDLSARVEVNAAYAEAGELIAHDFVETPAAYIEERAASNLDDVGEGEIRQSAIWRQYSGNIMGAVMSPAFALGFALAYRMFAEKGGAR